jgi:hypothetical protein
MSKEKNSADKLPLENSQLNEKLKAVNLAMEQIEKQHGKGSIMRLSDTNVVNVDAISTGCLSLDAAIGIGGVPRGRIIEIYGPESSGKIQFVCISLLKHKKMVDLLPLLIQNMPWISNMLKN